MNIKEIIVDYLEKNGYQGLVNPGFCGCSIEDIDVCESINTRDCQPAYIQKCTGSRCYDFHTCSSDCFTAIKPEEKIK